MDTRPSRLSGVRAVERPLPVLAIVGRPNVGKSTLFNRLVRSRRAIVDDQPGVTRDRNYAEAEWDGRRFLVVDTGGFEPDPGQPLARRVQEQSRIAVEEADVVLFLLDGKLGLNPLDREAVERLRRVRKPVFFAVNKIDAPAKEAALYEFYALGLDEIFPLSAEHGLGLESLMDRIQAAFPALDDREEQAEPEQAPLCLAIVGRPNVGKSTLVNRLLGYERSLVDSRPGTTRDALDSPLRWQDDFYILVDTAGIRRKSRIAERVERYSVVKALRSVDRGDLIIHLIDGPEGVTDQDAQILAYASRRGKGLVLAVNKWDLVPAAGVDGESYKREVYHTLAFVDFAPVVLISAETGRGVESLMGAVRRVAHGYQQKIQTAALNRAVHEAVGETPPPVYRGREVKVYYATQTDVRPPTFTLFVNAPQGLVASYRRHLVHRLRSALGLEGTPIRLVVRPRRESRRR